MSKRSRRSRKPSATRGVGRSWGPILVVLGVVAGALGLIVLGSLGSRLGGVTTVAPPTAAPRPATLTPEAEQGAAPVSAEVQQRNGLYDEPPPVRIKRDKFYQAVIRTSKGDINLQLYHLEAPQAVNSFVFLAEEGFYNDMPFWAVNAGEVAMSGDPLGNGQGGPGYDLPLEISNWKHIKPGMVALGRFPNSMRANGSQFYITLAAQPEFDGRYPIFGEVIQGMETVDRLAAGDLIEEVLIFEVEPPQLLRVTPTPAN